MGRKACSCLPSWQLFRPGRHSRSKLDDTSRSTVSETAARSSGRAQKKAEVPHTDTHPVSGAHPTLAHGQFSSRLFKSATSVRGEQLRSQQIIRATRRFSARISRRPTYQAEVTAAASAAAGTGDSCGEDANARRTRFGRFYRRGPHGESLLRKQQHTSPRQYDYATSSCFSMPPSPLCEKVDQKKQGQQEPYAIEVRFGSLLDIPATREGDKVEYRVFYCFVYFDDEDPAAVAADPSRCTQPTHGFYSGCTRYEVPFGGEVLEVVVPKRRTSNDKAPHESSKKKLNRENNTASFAVAPEHSPTGGDTATSPAKASSEQLREPEAHLHPEEGAGTASSNNGQESQKESDKTNQRMRDTAHEDEEEVQAKRHNQERDDSITGTHEQQTGTDTVSSREKLQPEHASTSVYAFRVGVIEEAEGGRVKTMKGTTAPLIFSDPKLLQKSIWPLVDLVNGRRTSAGAVRMCCRLVYAAPARNVNAATTRSLSPGSAPIIAADSHAQPKVENTEASPLSVTCPASTAPETSTAMLCSPV